MAQKPILEIRDVYFWFVWAKLRKIKHHFKDVTNMRKKYERPWTWNWRFQESQMLHRSRMLYKNFSLSCHRGCFHFHLFQVHGEAHPYILSENIEIQTKLDEYWILSTSVLRVRAMQFAWAQTLYVILRSSSTAQHWFQSFSVQYSSKCAICQTRNMISWT